MKNSYHLNNEQMDAFAEAAVKYAVEQKLRSKYDKILSAKAKNKAEKTSIIKKLPIAKIAAVAIVLLGSLFIIQQSLFSPSINIYAQTLLDQTLLPGNPDITRKGITDASQLQREANDAFIAKNYPLAIEKYTTLHADKKMSHMDQFYLGVAQMKVESFDEAIVHFSFLKNEAKLKIEEVDWLLSLAYVLSNQNEMAIPLLIEIVDSKGYKWKKAQQLLDKIQ